MVTPEVSSSCLHASPTVCGAMLSICGHVCRLEARLNRTQGRLGDALAQAAELRSSKGPSETSSHS